MSYRDLEIGGEIYQYTIGKTHTKIRGIGAFSNEDIGTPTGDDRVKVGPAEVIAVINRELATKSA